MWGVIGPRSRVTWPATVAVTATRPVVACQRALSARRRPRSCQLAQRGELRDRVTAELRAGRSPVAIWADLVATT